MSSVGIALDPAAELLDPASPLRTDPYPAYHELRTTRPVYFSDRVQAWVLSSYEHCVEVLRGPAWSSDFRNSPTFRDCTANLPGLPELLATVMLTVDPPDHTRLRGLVSQAFTPRAVERLRPSVEAICADLVAAAGERDRIEFIGDIAFPLPVAVICELLGVPFEDQAMFRTEVPKLAGIIEWQQTPDMLEAATFAAFALGGYLAGIIDERRRRPRSDLISALTQAEADGDRLNPMELLSTVLLLLAAGHETTVNLLGNGLAALLRHPDQYRLVARAGPQVARNAVEELLRYDSPVQLTGRVALVNHTVGESEIRAGDEVLCLLGAANRDPAHFDQPDRLHVERPDPQHLSFSAGAHYCLGAALARLEARVAFPYICQRLASFQLAEEPKWRRTATLRGVTALHLARR